MKYLVLVIVLLTAFIFSTQAKGDFFECDPNTSNYACVMKKLGNCHHDVQDLNTLLEVEKAKSKVCWEHLSICRNDAVILPIDDWMKCTGCVEENQSEDCKECLGLFGPK